MNDCIENSCLDDEAITGRNDIRPSYEYLRMWTDTVNDEFHCFKDAHETAKRLWISGTSAFTIGTTGVFGYIIIEDFLGDKCLCEIMFYIRKGFRGNIRLLKRYITEIEKIAIDNNCKTVKIGSNIGYKDDSFIRVLNRWGYKADTVSKGI